METTTYIHVLVDCNDADYLEKISKVKQKDLPGIYDIAHKISLNKEGHNFPVGEMANIDDIHPEDLYGKELVDMMRNYLPNPEYGFHTIEKIEIFEVYDSKVLL